MKNKLDSFLTKHYSSDLFSYQHIFKMLFPIILDTFFISAISMLTTSMISSSSESSVAAVSLITPINMLLITAISALASGGTVVIAQYKGRNDHTKILSTAGHTLLFTFLSALVLNCITIFFSSFIVNQLFFGASTIVLEKATSYLIGTSIANIILAIYVGVFSIFRGMGETKICLYLTVFLNFTYFILSFFFINILHLDIMGTILAFNIARMLGAIVAIYYLFMKKNRILLMTKEYLCSFNPTLLKSILKISLPFSAEQCFFYGGAIIGQMIIADLGTQIIASNAIANSLFSLISATPIAVGTLATTIIGQCIGAEQKELARWYGSKLIHLGTFLVILSTLIFIPFHSWLIQLYQPDPSSISSIILLLLIALIPMPFVWSMSNITPHILRSAGDATYSSFISLLTMWSVRIGLGYILAITLNYGINGIWIAMSAEWLVRFCLFYFRYKSNRWLNKQTI